MYICIYVFMYICICICICKLFYIKNILYFYIIFFYKIYFLCKIRFTFIYILTISNSISLKFNHIIIIYIILNKK